MNWFTQILTQYERTDPIFLVAQDVDRVKIRGGNKQSKDSP